MTDQRIDSLDAIETTIATTTATTIAPDSHWP